MMAWLTMTRRVLFASEFGSGVSDKFGYVSDTKRAGDPDVTSRLLIHPGLDFALLSSHPSPHLPNTSHDSILLAPTVTESDTSYRPRSSSCILDTLLSSCTLSN